VGAVSSIMITASHNPAKYNGYKVYGEDGAQLGVAESALVLAAIQKTDMFTGVRRMDASLAIREGLITVMDEAVLSAYSDAVCACLKNPALAKAEGADLKIVYTPFHGTGFKPVMRALKTCGFTSVYPVEAQTVPDPNFSTVRSPNPEEPDGFLMATDLANEKDADIIIGTDPDSDRIGVLCKQNGEYTILNGNQTGILLLDYILSQEKNLTKDDYVVSTIVSSNMVSRMADFYGVSSYRVYTGFRFIASIIKHHEDESLAGRYLFGFEESYGYLPGTYARDKDAVSAALLIAEAALYYKKQGKTLLDLLDFLWQTHGYFIERTDSVYMEGLDGLEKMQALLAKTAQNPFKTIGSMNVRAFYNYQEGYKLDFESGEKTALSFEPSNVLYFELPENGFFILRPSGTEPKIKLYFSVRGNSQADAQNKLSELSAAVTELLS